MQQALAAAKTRHAAVMKSAFTAWITIAGTTVKGAASESRREVMGMDGGFQERLVCEIILAIGDIAESTLINATTGVDKRQTITVDTRDGRTARTYRITSVKPDTHRTQWKITAEQAVN